MLFYNTGGIWEKNLLFIALFFPLLLNGLSNFKSDKSLIVPNSYSFKQQTTLDIYISLSLLPSLATVNRFFFIEDVGGHTLSKNC